MAAGMSTLEVKPTPAKTVFATVPSGVIGRRQSKNGWIHSTACVTNVTRAMYDEYSIDVRIVVLSQEIACTTFTTI